MKIYFELNGVPHYTEVEPGESLLSLLRRVGAKSVKEGCGSGECSTCTVLVDGRAARSCLMFAPKFKGKRSPSWKARIPVRSPSLATGVCGGRRGAVRVLRPGGDPRGSRAPLPHRQPHPGRSPGGHRWEPLPLHGIPENRGCGAAGRGLETGGAIEIGKTVVGRKVRKVDGLALATGQPKFTLDLDIPGALVGKILPPRPCEDPGDRDLRGGQRPRGGGDPPLREHHAHPLHHGWPGRRSLPLTIISCSIGR